MPIDQLSITFAALADPTKRAILARLSQGQAAVLDLAKPFNITLPAVSKPLKVLEKAGLIGRPRQSALAAVHLSSQAVAGCSSMDRGLPQVLGGKFRSSRRLSERVANGN